MNIEQIYTGCLAQGAYYIESEGEVAIIDPLREVQNYIDKASGDNATVKYIFETHFHADFVSGHVTLSEKTGAPIIYGPTATPEFNSIIAEDNQIFELGNVKIKVLHTPGHTMESTSYLLLDENGKEHALFSGDTLFLGDVGRPDLAQKATNMTQDELAGILYDSLRDRIMTLPDSTIVYPGHGAGSACGKKMSKETVGSIGEQKEQNYALRADMTKEEFIKEVTDGLASPPAYFPLNVMLNKTGYESIDSVLEKGSKGLAPSAFEVAANEKEAIMLDVRHQSEFVKAHVPNSIFIGIDGGFAPWVGALIKDIKQPILLITPEGRLEETIVRLSRVGFDQVIGYLEGGMEAWINSGGEVASIDTISAEDFAQLSAKEELAIYDVRKDTEYEATHLVAATNTPLDSLNDHLAEFKTEGVNYVHCAGGYRSVIANSILKSRGIHNLVDVLGGFGAIKKTNMEIADFSCSSST